MRWNQFKKILRGILLADLVLAGAVLWIFIGRDIDEHIHVWKEGGNPFYSATTDGSGSIRIKDEQGVKQIALTFDDGPHEEYTSLLLDGLKARDVKVTFFLMGENIKGNEELVRRMEEEGHLIGNHSYKHMQLTKVGEEKVCQAIEQTNQIIEGITGIRPVYLRPPYGDWNEDLECEVGMSTVFWSVDSLDWKYQNRAKTVKKILKDMEAGDVILMHDIFQPSVDAALEVIDTLEREGYTFVTVDELLID